MPRFRVNASVHGGKYIGVFEAETKEEAVALAEQSEECHVSLCHQCSGQVENAEIEELHAERLGDDE